MSEKIANPLSRLASVIYDRAVPSTGPRPTPSVVNATADQYIDSEMVRLWIRQHLAGQKDDAAQGRGEQYRPEEAEAKNVPLSTEIPGFVRDFEWSLEKNFFPHLPNRMRDGHQNNLRGQIAEKFYAMAAEVKSFRGAGTHEFITCLELADRLDPNIKYRLSEQIVQDERTANGGDDEDYSPSRAGARIRQIVGLIDGIVAGKICIHPQEVEQDGGFVKSSKWRGEVGAGTSL